VAGTELKNLVDKLYSTNPITATKVRARLRYNMATALTGQVYGPWRYMPGYLDGHGTHNNIPLPVELLYFSADCEQDKPLLNWATASERNSSHFSVERSVVGSEWIPIGELPAAGNSQQVVEYRFTDPQPSGEPVVYYRLRQTDLDGQEEVFDVVPLMNCTATDITLLVYPNPVMDVLHVVAKVAGSAEENYTLELLDAMGRPVKQHTIGIAAGQGTADLDLAGLAAGSYTLALRDAMGSSVSRTQVVKH